MSCSHRKPGFIVLIVMIVIMMLSLAGLSFVLNLSTENKAVHLQGDQLQLQQALASGVELLRGFLDQPQAERQHAGGWVDNATVFQAIAVTGGEAGAIHFSVLSPGTVETGTAALRYGLQDESVRLNLASLAEWDRREPGAGTQALLNLPGMTESAADSIMDWLDADATARPAGAEAEYYTSRGLPYEPRNGAPFALDELLLVRDVSRISLFGLDNDGNYRLDPRETQRGTTVTDQVAWASLLTVYSGQRNRASDGRPRIYLNEPDLRKLHQQLSETFNSDWADFVIAYRQYGPDGSATAEPPRTATRGASRTRSGAIQAPRRRGRPPQAGGAVVDLSLPAQYEIESALDLIGARVTLPVQQPPPGQPEEPPVILQNPLDDQPDQLREYLPNWMDLTTTTEDQVIRGRVNINEAPRVVLLGIPGLDATTVDRILAARGAAAGGADADRRDPVWLLTERIVELPELRQLLPYICGGGDVFRCQVVAFDRQVRLSARAEVVLDATVSPPRQVYWKDLGLLGRGFAADELGGETLAGSAARDPAY